MHFVNVRMIKPRQRARFVHKPTQAPLVVRPVRLGGRPHPAVGDPQGKLPRQVFLERHDLGEVGVVDPVGDPKAPPPQYGEDLVAPQLRPHR